MTIHAISHLAIGVRDLARSVAFYRDVLGMPVVVEEIETFAQGGDVWGAGTRKAAYIRWKEGPRESFLVLDEWPEDKRPKGEPAKLFQLGVHHFGFWVDDVDTVLDRARKEGHEVRMKPNEADSKTYGEPAGKTIRVAFLQDPDGNIVQLDQRI